MIQTAHRRVHGVRRTYHEVTRYFLVIICLRDTWADTKFSGNTRGLRIDYLLCEYLYTACAIK